MSDFTSDFLDSTERAIDTLTNPIDDEPPGATKVVVTNSGDSGLRPEREQSLLVSLAHLYDFTGPFDDEQAALRWITRQPAQPAVVAELQAGDRRRPIKLFRVLIEVGKDMTDVIVLAHDADEAEDLALRSFGHGARVVPDSLFAVIPDHARVVAFQKVEG